MDIEKIKYSKCPNCKKYGINANRGIRYHYTDVETCKYCGKKFRVNSALAFILKCFVPLIYGGICLIINTYIFEVPFWVIGMIGIILFLFVERICPMEEVKDK